MLWDLLVEIKTTRIKLFFFKNIFSYLKKDGILFFCENLNSTFVHNFFRRKFVNWGRSWNYLKYNEINLLLKEFRFCDIKTYGFFECFGINEFQQSILYRIDKLFCGIIPKKYRYILSCVAIK